MKEWIEKLYILIIKRGAKVEDLRSYVNHYVEDVEWIEDADYPFYDDQFRYGNIERLIAHEIHWANRK